MSISDKWEMYPNNAKYDRILLGKHICLVRLLPMDKGFLWQVNKFYGYAKSVELAKIEAEEMLSIALATE